MTHAHVETRRKNFSAHTTHYILYGFCKARPSCLLPNILERDYWHRSVFVDLLWIWKCVPKTRNQPLCLTELKSEDIFGELLRTWDETSWVFAQNKEPALKTVHGHSQAQVLTRNVRLSRGVWFNWASCVNCYHNWPNVEAWFKSGTHQVIGTSLSWNRGGAKWRVANPPLSSLKHETCCFHLPHPPCCFRHGSSNRCLSLLRHFSFVWKLTPQQIFCPQRASMLSLKMLRSVWKCLLGIINTKKWRLSKT